LISDQLQVEIKVIVLVTGLPYNLCVAELTFEPLNNSKSKALFVKILLGTLFNLFIPISGQLQVVLSTLQVVLSTTTWDHSSSWPWSRLLSCQARRTVLSVRHTSLQNVQ
jgi:hypothetical protein